ncbi:uncharacterized protein LOC134253397 [Saccostrea cucullata]|uniref:uncharacterized protein LOC134253397 n=1 Tax=Saccostrea cuccullata TaxID=36930 RepID=UPI002ED38D20
MDIENDCRIATTKKQHGLNKVVEENDIQIETDEKHMRTVKEHTFTENPIFLTSVDTQALESLILGKTDKINQTEPEARTTKFGSTLSSTDSLTSGSKQTDMKWSGGEIESKPIVLPGGQKPVEIRLSNSVRARMRKMAQFSIEKKFMQK